MSAIVPDLIERYLASLNRLADPVLLDIAREGREAGLPIVDAEVGGLLQALATAIRSRRILEIGTAIGYSGIWLARALPTDGMLITIEIDSGRAEQARANFARAGVANRVHVLVGDAARLQPKLAGPFDLIFDDGDKVQYGVLHDRLVELLRPAGMLITDNVLWSGEVVPGFVQEPPRPAEARAIAAYNQRLAADTRLITAIVPLRDGVAISVKRP